VERCDSVLAIELMAIVRDSPFVAGERWEGSYECTGRKATSSLVVTEVEDDGTVVVVLEFDYADSKGSFVAQGKPSESGALELAFVEWKDRPGDFAPITPAGQIDAASGEYTGKLAEPDCADFKYIRRTN
jgi:hypothetical protein